MVDAGLRSGVNESRGTALGSPGWSHLQNASLIALSFEVLQSQAARIHINNNPLKSRCLFSARHIQTHTVVVRGIAQAMIVIPMSPSDATNLPKSL
jgi:hypothetical protein